MSCDNKNSIGIKEIWFLDLVWLYVCIYLIVVYEYFSVLISYYLKLRK